MRLQAICKQLEAGQGALYRVIEEDGKRTVELKMGYALSIGESTVIKYEFGEGLIGQSAANGNTLYVDDVPEGYIKIVSGLGSASPKYLLIVPVKNNDQVLGIIELASFTEVSEDQRKFVEEAAQLIADKISTKHKFKRQTHMMKNINISTKVTFLILGGIPGGDPAQLVSSATITT